MKMAVFWVVAPCSVARNASRHVGAFCLRHKGDGDGSKHI
jgi:hypothetical protein